MSHSTCFEFDNHYMCTEPKDHAGDHIARGTRNQVCHRWPQAVSVQVAFRTRRQRLISLTTGGSITMGTLSTLLDCPEASIRRSIQELRAEGYYIVLKEGDVTNYGLRSAIIARETLDA